jgi:hypothetical protein
VLAVVIPGDTEAVVTVGATTTALVVNVTSSPYAVPVEFVA